MPKILGGPKTGGRQKGTPNKKTLYLNEILNELNYSLPEKILELVENLKHEKKVDVLLELMSYVYPKRKAIEVHETNPSSKNLQIMFVKASSEDETTR